MAGRDALRVDALAQARVGTLLKGKWHLDSLLGAGGMATVYAATHRNGSRVAVKILHPEISQCQDIRERFLREGYVANAVGHPGVVRVHDDDVAEDGAVFLVMDLLDGEELAERWKRNHKQLTPAEVLSIASCLLDILAAAHDRGVIHRDIKPQNIFITRSADVKILDFGIARLRDAPRRSEMATQEGVAMGTPGFMAPEQARGDVDAIDARTDLWAVGAMMFTLLAGRTVHQGSTAAERMVAAITMPAPSLATALPDLAPAIVHVVDRALKFHKQERWPDARAMQQAVAEAYASLARGTASSAEIQISSLSTAVTVRRTEVAVASTEVRTTGPAVSPAVQPHPAPSPPLRRWAPVTMGGLMIAAAVVTSFVKRTSEVSPPKQALSSSAMEYLGPERPAPDVLATSAPTAAPPPVSAAPTPSSSAAPSIDAGRKPPSTETRGRASMPLPAPPPSSAPKVVEVRAVSSAPAPAPTATASIYAPPVPSGLWSEFK